MPIETIDMCPAPTTTPCVVCDGSPDSPQGCRACCRDCGFACVVDKDDEGFHVGSPAEPTPRVLSKSEQARADSLADAATLLRYLEQEYCRARVGACSARPLNYGRLRNLLYWDSIDIWERRPRELARAAFKCVPALRGEQ